MPQCLSPITMEQNGANNTFPCGKCPNCAAARTSSWSFRLQKEAEQHKIAYFLTLTYDTEHVPITKRGFMSLRKTDIPKWIKQLRRNHDLKGIEHKIKYFAVGEYGGKTKRPHYHIILFGADQEIIEKTWTYGKIHYGSISGASVGYTLKYITKGRTVPEHQNDDREKEFSLMSKKLGINYVDYAKNWHQSDYINRSYAPLENGKKGALGRYLKEKLFTNEQKGLIKARFTALGESEKQKRFENPEETYKFNASKIAAFKRNNYITCTQYGETL